MLINGGAVNGAGINAAVDSTVVAPCEQPYGTLVAVESVQPLYYTVGQSLEQPYQATSLVVGALESKYDIQLYYFVAKEQSELYSLQLIAMSEHGYGDCPVIQVAHVQGYEPCSVIQAAIVQDYGDCAFLEAVLSQRYDDLTLIVESSQGYAITDIPLVRVACNQGYSLLVPVSVELSQSYSSVMVAAASSHAYGLTHVLTLRAVLEQPYAIFTQISVDSSQRYGDEVIVSAGVDQSYDMSAYNRSVAALEQFYTMLSDTSVRVDDTIEVLVGSKVIEVAAINITSDEGNFVWNTEFILANPDDAVYFYELSLFSAVVNRGTVDAETWNFVVDTKTITRGSSASVEVKIDGYSPAIKYAEPYANLQTYLVTEQKMASVLVSELLESVTWNTVDWQLPAYRFGARLVTPAKAAALILEAVGATMLSNPDGTLYAQPLYPDKVADYATATPTHTLSDIEDNLSCTNDGAVSVELNNFRIIEGNTSFSDKIEQEPITDEVMAVMLRVLPTPWRESISVVHTDGTDIDLTRIGVSSTTVTDEQVEFAGGLASLKYPAATILGFTWLTTSLGSISIVNPRMPNVATSDAVTNSGYGVALVTYTYDSIAYKATNKKDIGQFLVIDSEII